MIILVTGVAGFIGHAVASRLLDNGHAVIGVDNLNPYYSPVLKRMRLARLTVHPNFEFHQLDLADPAGLENIPGKDDVERVVHFAAQAGVRYSMEKPFPYVASNIVGHLTVLEFCRNHPKHPELIYASSSSVYGEMSGSAQSEQNPVGAPASLYAVTKQADELMSQAYTALYGLNQIGLRLFTVYGPWGRPDMAYWLFTASVLRGEPINLFNRGEMARDLTYIKDVETAICRLIESDAWADSKEPSHDVYNLGSGTSHSLRDLVGAVERATDRQAQLRLLPLQKGDVLATCADTAKFTSVFGEIPHTPLENGIATFVDWYKSLKDPQVLEE
ncbi:MAG: NAD-dependent epimerase/dehydratase family protein [Pseudomonadota bacterium]